MTARRDHADHDPMLDAAREEAEGIEVFASLLPEDVVALRGSEAAQGIETFANPDGLLAPGVIREGEPGHEVLSGDLMGLDTNGEERRPAEDDWEA